MTRLYRARFSTNVQRVALALAHKGLEVESVWISYDDRGEVERVSGQGLVPVIVDGDTVVADSTAILEYLDGRWPERPLYPSEPARRAETVLLIDWFNRVWKRWPNEIEAELGQLGPDRARVAELAALMAGALERFDALLAGRDFLGGERLGALDCAAYPFLKYAAGRDPADDELFHRILDEHQRLDERHHRLRAWIERMGELPEV